MKRAFTAIGIAIFAASASAQSAPSTADFVKTVAISDMFEISRVSSLWRRKSPLIKLLLKGWFTITPRPPNNSNIWSMVAR